MIICLERGADLHIAKLVPLPLTVSCFSKIQIGFTFLVLTHLGSPGQRAIKWVWVVLDKGPLNGCVCVYNLVIRLCNIKQKLSDKTNMPSLKKSADHLPQSQNNIYQKRSSTLLTAHFASDTANNVSHVLEEL